jgi:hypothetical protein
VETWNVLDMGTSILLDAHVRTDFTVETALECVVQSFQKHGLPHAITVDRDPRWVGNACASDFPSALIRMCACLGIEVEVGDPEHPQQNGFVEGSNRTSKQECFLKDHPPTLEEAREVTVGFHDHDKRERPNQALSCGNRPPLTAFPHLPQLSQVAAFIDPDSWLETWHGVHLERKVDQLGTIRIDLKRYAVGHRFLGQRVTAAIDAPSRSLHIDLEHQLLKVVPLKAHGMRNELVEELISESASESWTGLGIECGKGGRNRGREHEKGGKGEERRQSRERRPKGSTRRSRAIRGERRPRADG